MLREKVLLEMFYIQHLAVGPRAGRVGEFSGGEVV
jgi:hypothetical protein